MADVSVPIVDPSAHPLLWGGAAFSLLLVIWAGLADRRSRRRRDLDRIGVVSWPTVQFLAVIAVLACGYFAFELR